MKDTFITLTQTGTIIDLDAVTAVVPTTGTLGNGIRVILRGMDHNLFQRDAHQFLDAFHDYCGAATAPLDSQITNAEPQPRRSVLGDEDEPRDDDQIPGAHAGS